MQTILEDTWNPVQLGNRKGGYKISSQSVSSQWFNSQLVNEGDRKLRLQRYHELDITCVEIGRALDIISEDISSCNADDEETFYIDYPDSGILKSTVKLLEAARELWGQRTNMEYGLYDAVRNTLKYGATFYKKCEDGSLIELPTERMVGYILDLEDETTVTHYIYDPSVPLIEDMNRPTKKTSLRSGDGESNVIAYAKNDLIIFKIGKRPLGESILERVYATAKRLILLEDAVVVYRILRAPERRLYYIDVGNLAGPKRDAAIEKQRIALMQKNANKRGQQTTEFDPHSIAEDIFIPTNSSGKGSRVETLPGGQNMGELGDVEYFAKKLAAGLRIPYSMIDTYGDNQNQYSDMRIGQLYQIEMRYMGFIKRFARKFSSVLDLNFKEYCLKRNIVVPENVWLCITPPMSFALYKEMELQQQQLNLASSTMNLPSIAKKTVMATYLHMDADEINRNEEAKLLELGLSQEQIKKLEPNERDNLVYADQKNQKIMKKYGLADEQDVGGFR